MTTGPIYIPMGGQIPFDEPARLPPANPAEEAELNTMIAGNRLNQWRYVGECLYKMNPDGTKQTVSITGIDAAMLNAWLKGKFGAWPMPSKYDGAQWPKPPPPNAVSVSQYPT